MKTTLKMFKRETIENKLKDYLKENFNDKVKTDRIKEFMTNKGYTLGEITHMINLNQYPEMWTLIDLGIMALAIDNIDGLNIEDYFDNEQIESFKNFYYINKKQGDEPIIFDNAFPVGYFAENSEPTQFMVSQVPIQMIRELFANKKVGYDPDMQRDLIRLQDKKGEVTEKINLDKGKKGDVAQKTLSHDMFSNPITLNVLRNGQQKVSYNWESHKLIIENNEYTNTFIIDGYNRSMGYIEALDKEPDAIFYTSVNVCIHDKHKAGQVIADIDKQTPISKSKAKILSTSNSFMEIVKRINKFGGNIESNEMYNKIAENFKEYEMKNDKYCTFETLADSIKYNFFDDNNEKIQAFKIDDTTEFIVKGFNRILGLLKEKYDSIENIKQNGYYLENNTFIGYIALLSYLQDKDNWKQLLEKSINNINFDKNNDDWRVLEISSSNSKKPVIKKISKYFIERGVI
jgi:hypothetical protein